MIKKTLKPVSFELIGFDVFPIICLFMNWNFQQIIHPLLRKYNWAFD